MTGTVLRSELLRGTFAAAVTPLRAAGRELDRDAFKPVVDFLVTGGVDGLLALGTTGEGILFSLAERRRVAELFVDAASGRVKVAVNCGAQTTAETVALAEHAAASGADAVAVIAPPYFPLDGPAILAHLEAAARACAPTPFYVYEFARASGYAVPVEVILELRDRVPNLAGMKVSDTPWTAFAPYLLDGLDVLVGPEMLIHQGIEHGAVGAVSALAASFPEAVAAAVRTGEAELSDGLGALRAQVERFPRHATLKRVLKARGVPVGEDVRPPLRGLTGEERDQVDSLIPSWLEGAEVDGFRDLPHAGS